MKKKIGLAFSVAVAAPGLCATGAWAQASGPVPGFYIGGEGGYTHLNDMSGLDGSAAGSTLHNDDGFTAGIFGGYAFGNGLRLEGELPFRYNDTQSVSRGAPSVNASGHVTSRALMANALYDFHIFPNLPLTPFVGGGIGAARLGIEDFSAPGASLGHDHDTQFAYQAIAGLEYALTPQWSASLTYKYFATSDPTFDGSITGGGSYRTTYHTHNVLLGIAYHFGAPEAPPPMAEVPPPPPPPVQQQAAAPATLPPRQNQTFLVFFDFDRADLSEAAKQVVANAAQYARTNGKTTIDVSGYTDSSGGPAYNRRLSRRRADAVASYLLTLGIPKTGIIEAARGPDDPRVPTPPNTREPRNRRVEIVMP